MHPVAITLNPNMPCQTEIVVAISAARNGTQASITQNKVNATATFGQCRKPLAHRPIADPAQK